MTSHENRAEETTQDPGWSWWWLLVALPTLLMGMFLLSVLLGSVIGSNAFTVGLFAVFVIVALFGAPISLLALYSDARYLRRIGASWQPDWWKYALVAVLFATLVIAVIGIEDGGPGSALGNTSFGLTVGMTPVGLFYLFRRFRTVGMPQR